MFSELKISLYLILLSIPLHAQQQKASIQQHTRSIKTYPFSDPDPVARPGRIYPYFRFDGYTNNASLKEWKVIEIENNYIRLAIMPEIGGKIWSAYEKSKEFPFIFSNHAVKFRDVAMRGAWTSGGIEFNFGDYGHAPTTSSPVDYFIRTNTDGSVSCFIGATDWSSRTTWRVEINLAPDKAYFTTRSWWHNGTPFEQSYYNWTNAGFRAPGNLEYIYPGTHYIGHSGEFDTYPVDSVGRKISYYEQNNFGSYKSYHVVGRPTDFYGGFWHDYNMGVGHYAPYHEKLGKKAWSWGLSREGLLWEGLLTDTDGPNVELQSGRLFSQANPKSMNSPFKHVAFSPYSVDSWNEHWFPIKQTRGMTHSTLHGALNLRVEGDWLKVDWMALENISDTLAVNHNGTTLLSRKLSMLPMQVIKDSVKWIGDVNELAVVLGDEFITNEDDGPSGRPLEAPDNFNWTSEYGLLLSGTDLAHQRNYAEAEKHLAQSLQLNPNLLPALTQMAQIRYRQGQYDTAREMARQALAINTYDPEANYFWGLSSDATGHYAEATDGFSVAALDQGLRTSALLRLAYLKISRANWTRAFDLISESLAANPQNEDAVNAKGLILRKQGHRDAAQSYVQRLLDKDPLNHFARFEKFILSGIEKDKLEFVGMIQQEMKHEVFLEMAIRYYQWNLAGEALQVLALAPAHPMVHLWQAYLLDKSGDRAASDLALNHARSATPQLVFPFRPESHVVLQWAAQRNSHWKWSYYDGLIYWQNNQLDEARKLFTDCGAKPDFVPFYMAKAELFRDDASQALEALERAYQLEPTSWRTGSKLARFYASHAKPAEALRIAEKNHQQNPDSYVVGLQYAEMLTLNKQYANALNALRKLNMLPAEHALDAPRLFRETNMLYAIENMKGKKWQKAIQSLQQAETWPENLGAGKPYHPDNRMTQFLLAFCYDQQNKKSLAETSLSYVSTYKNNDKEELDPLNNKLAEEVKRHKGDYRGIAKRLVSDSALQIPLYLREFLTILE